MDYFEDCLKKEIVLIEELLRNKKPFSLQDHILLQQQHQHFVLVGFVLDLLLRGTVRREAIDISDPIKRVQFINKILEKDETQQLVDRNAGGTIGHALVSFDKLKLKYSVVFFSLHKGYEFTPSLATSLSSLEEVRNCGWDLSYLNTAALRFMFFAEITAIAGVDAPSLAMFMVRLDGALKNLI
ncbi:hypothetical protein DUI87_09443 [Hirundo rustica rustica]|uniref:Uncharacterized protein n=1 Tax=Hirundo rustica rustica TaxID=333673 RepID=A0A3M0KM79_HIRRU|nr:hypothetical protein DUI87_09443 [Hirundo rustica rustica]